MINLITAWDKNKSVNSAFGYRSSASTGGVGSTNHKGIDLSSNNDSIPSVLDGTVIENAWNNARGWYITIKNSDGYTSRYQHLASKSPLTVGTRVTEGQTIGTQGSTGNSTGKHLHFEVLDTSGKYVDPVPYLSGGKTSYTATTMTDAHGRPITAGATVDAGEVVSGSLGSIAQGILSKVVTFLVVLLVIILAVILFMKAFDIKIF